MRTDPRAGCGMEGKKPRSARCGSTTRSAGRSTGAQGMRASASAAMAASTLGLLALVFLVLSIYGALAIPLGSMMGWFPRWFGAVNPIVQLLRPISPIAWIPLAILWFGVGDLSAVFIIFLASLFPITLTAMNAVRGVELVHVNAARNFGLRGPALLRRVIYPAILPQLLVGLRLALGIAWLVVVAAEMIAVSSGLGFLIIDARNAGNRYDLVVAGMVLIGAIGIALDALMRGLERSKALAWGYTAIASAEEPPPDPGRGAAPAPAAP